MSRRRCIDNTIGIRFLPSAFYKFCRIEHRNHDVPSSSLHQRLVQTPYLPCTATSPEIKQSYRCIALALHPNRNNGCPTKSDEFKAVTEAYTISKRKEYDTWLSGVQFEDDRIIKKGVSWAAERNPFYRKVYLPTSPLGMKTFDRQSHYGEWSIYLMV
jgi:molecular chaperone DnaJ